jgi:hypothetical protein
MGANKNKLVPEFSVALQCAPKYVQARLIALGHSTICGRCGGSGSYSYCQMYGTTCFGCGGTGKVATRLTSKLLAEVSAQVAAGELKPYLARIAARAAAKRTYAKFFAIWGSLPTIAADKAAGKHWSDQSDRCADINAFCSHILDVARPIMERIESGKLSDVELAAHTQQIDKLAALLARGEDLAIARPRYADNRPIPEERAEWSKYMAALIDS